MSHRTQITLTDRQYRRLKRRSEESGLSLSELVRRAIDAFDGRDNAETLAALRSSFGAWSDRDDDEDGKAYVERIRTGRRWQELD